MSDAYIDVVFDGPPGPESGRFIEVEGPDGASIGAGEWIERENGLWALRLDASALPLPDALVQYAASVRDVAWAFTLRNPDSGYANERRGAIRGLLKAVDYLGHDLAALLEAIQPEEVFHDA